MTTYPHGAPCWVDLGTPEPERAAVFYRRVFGWTVEPADVADYRICRLDGRLVAALGPADDVGAPYWTTNVSVTDVELTAAAIHDNGGKIVAGPGDAGAIGRFAVTIDSVGAPLSLWQPLLHAGAEVRQVPGAWTASHLMTDEPGRARQFYRSVIGWHSAPSDAATGRFTLDGSDIATIGPIPKSIDLASQSRWLVIFGIGEPIGIENLIIDAGGNPLSDDDTGTPNTRLFEDDQGSVFGVRSSN